MIVMLGGCSNAWWHRCAGAYPGKVGMLTAPSYFRPIHTSEWFEFACDNGKFSVWSKGLKWDESAFYKMLDWIRAKRRAPRFVVVPDVVGDKRETLRLWDFYESRLRQYHWPLAMAMQDGMTPPDCRGDVAFIGGTTNWKWHNAERFCKELPRVHVARVELGNLTKAFDCADWGAESIDSTGSIRDGSESWRFRKIEEFLRDKRPLELAI